MGNEKRRIVQCRRCNSVFNVNQAKEVEKDYYGIVIKEKRCPICNGNYRYLSSDWLEKNRDRWILHSPAPQKVIELYKYNNREN